MIGIMLSYLLVGVLSLICGAILMCVVQYRRYNEIEALQKDLQLEIERLKNEQV